MRIVSLIALLFLLSSCGLFHDPKRDQSDVLDFYEVEEVIISGNSSVANVEKLLDDMGIKNNYGGDPREQSHIYYAITKEGEHVFITSPYKEKYNTYLIPFPFPKFDEVITQVEAFNEDNNLKEIEEYSDITLVIRDEKVDEYGFIGFMDETFSLESPYNIVMPIGSIYINSKYPGTAYVYIYAMSETEFAFIHDYEEESVILWEFTID